MAKYGRHDPRNTKFRRHKDQSKHKTEKRIKKASSSNKPKNFDLARKLMDNWSISEDV